MNKIPVRRAMFARLTAPQVAGLALMGLLLFVWPLPRTISLRDLLLLLTMVTAGIAAWRCRPSVQWSGLRLPLGLYVALTLWMFVVALFVTDETLWALDELRGQWLKGALALAAGGALAMGLKRSKITVRAGVLVIGAVLLFHIVYADYASLRGLFIQSGLLQRVSGLADAPDKVSYLSNMLMCFLLAEAYLRLTHSGQFIPLGRMPLIGLFALALLSVYAASMRNGVIELSLIFSMFAVLFVREYRRYLSPKIVVLVLFVLVLVTSTFAYLSYRSDERWQSFVDTIPLAWDTDGNRQWINWERRNELRLSNGEPVDWSNYMRMARIKAGADLVWEYPLGVGYGRNAFGHAVMKKYGEHSSHSHSGLVDLATGTGIPGVLLWIGFLFSLTVLGWRSFRQTRDYCALVLLFLTTGYGVRMVLDSIVRDHMLQMFLFLAAFLAVAAAGKPDGKAAPLGR